MSDIVDDSAFDRASGAMAQQKWEEAYSLLSAADQNQELAPDNLAVLAEAAYFAGHPEVSREAWERMHGVALRDRDTERAVRAALQVRGRQFPSTRLEIRPSNLIPVPEETCFIQTWELDGPAGLPAWMATLKGCKRQAYNRSHEREGDSWPTVVAPLIPGGWRATR
jgi:hypothetical protein